MQFPACGVCGGQISQQASQRAAPIARLRDIHDTAFCSPALAYPIPKLKTDAKSHLRCPAHADAVQIELTA